MNKSMRLISRLMVPGQRICIRALQACIDVYLIDDRFERYMCKCCVCNQRLAERKRCLQTVGVGA